MEEFSDEEVVTSHAGQADDDFVSEENEYDHSNGNGNQRGKSKMVRNGDISGDEEDDDAEMSDDDDLDGGVGGDEYGFDDYDGEEDDDNEGKMQSQSSLKRTRNGSRLGAPKPKSSKDMSQAPVNATKENKKESPKKKPSPAKKSKLNENNDEDDESGKVKEMARKKKQAYDSDSEVEEKQRDLADMKKSSSLSKNTNVKAKEGNKDSKRKMDRDVDEEKSNMDDTKQQQPTHVETPKIKVADEKHQTLTKKDKAKSNKKSKLEFDSDDGMQKSEVIDIDDDDENENENDVAHSQENAGEVVRTPSIANSSTHGMDIEQESKKTDQKEQMDTEITKKLDFSTTTITTTTTNASTVNDKKGNQAEKAKLRAMKFDIPEFEELAPLPIQNLIKYPAGPAGDIARFILASNKPNTAANITDAMKEKLSKSVATKALDSLLVSKNGDPPLVQTDDKKKLYFPSQDLFPSKSDDEISALDGRIRIYADRVSALEKMFVDLQSFNALLAEEPTDNQLTQSIKETKEKADELEKSVRSIEEIEQKMLNGNGGKTIDENELKLHHQFFRRMWKERKEVVNEIIADICEAKNIKKPAAKNELLAEIGIETDESLNINFKDNAL